MTTIQEIMAVCNGSLTGDLQTDMEYLESQMKRYSKHPEAKEILREISDLAFSLLPPEKQAYLKETTFLNDKRLDAVFNDARELVKEKRYEEAALMLRALTNKVKEHFTSDDNKHYFSFRNPFEYHMYIQLYGTDDKIERASFDFAMFFNLLGYVLVELHRLDEAMEALEQAVRYNPVSSDIRYELAECFKAMQEPEKLLAVTRETLQIANGTYALARCYANAGFYCVEVKDYEAAVCFYYESLVYSNHPAVKAELRNVGMLMGKKISPPTREEVLAAFAKYNLPNGPSNELVLLAITLAKSAIEQERIELGAYFYSIAYDMTRDPDIKQRMEELRKEIAAQKKAASEAQSEE